MTPIKWVQKYDLRDGPQPIETGPVTFIPVLTLTDLEAWLQDEQQGNLETYVPNRLTYTDGLDRLLAQVQAWRTPGDTR